jgi:L-alanine-DL-glutamate epimerase-like enolase superfamily enzyme
MEITNVHVTKLAVDLDRPLGVSNHRSIDKRTAAIVVIETDAGITGIGEGVGPEAYEIETIVEKKYAPQLLGEDPLERERHWQTLVATDVYRDQKGAELSAASGVDMALWDIAGKHHGEPVHRLLGGDTAGTGTVRAYASDLFWDEPANMAGRAADYVDRGFPAVKTHLGNGIEADRTRVQAIQDAIGDAHLMVDMNCGCDRVEALKIGRMLEDAGVYWYEEPLPPRDIEGYVHLREKLAIPLAGGENEFTKWGFRRLFENGALDYAMPDVMRCGGLTEAKKICALAEAFEVTVSPHSFTTGVGLAATMNLIASTPNGEWLEFDTTGYELLEGMFKSPPEIDSDGFVQLPTEPGLGVELSDQVVETYGVE